MRLITILKFLLIFIVPCLLFLLVLNFAGFDSSFYKEKSSEYGVQQSVPEAISLHEKVIDFIKGKENDLPADFNEREQQHLWDVRSLVRISTIALYALIFLFVLSLVISAVILKVNNYITNFVGKVLIFGGFLTVVMAIILFFLISLDFTASFDSFHQLFFEKGTYTFDPAKEIITKIYPEQFFMDAGASISKNVVIASIAVVLIGLLLIFSSKRKK